MPTFSTIFGHGRQREELERDVDTGNIAHAYLFSGPSHLGKLRIALWLAEKLLTKDLTDTKLERAHHQIEKLTHPDLLALDQLWISGICEDWDTIAKSSNAPQEHRSSKSSPAKTDVISIDDIRALQERLYETSLAPYRCCIITSIERMKDEAANALLKILEEPPECLVFILTTQKESALLPTIVSRTRTVGFHPLSRKELWPLLEGLPEEDALFIQQIAQGAPGIVKRLSGDPDLLRAERQIHGKALNFWQAPTLRQRLQSLTPLHKRGEEANQLLLHMALTLRQQKPEQQCEWSKPLFELCRDLQTNTHRPLAVQRFALVTLEKSS